MGRFLAWIGKLIGTVMVGPGAVVLGDPGLDYDPPRTPWSPMTYRLIGLGFAAAVLAIARVPLPVIAIVLVLAAGLIGIERLMASRKRG